MSYDQDFETRFFGVSDKQILAEWEELDLPPVAPHVKEPVKVDLDIGTRVKCTSGVEQGMRGKVSAVRGDWRRIDLQCRWANIHVRQLEELP
mgnify:CR=1 FL=1